MSDLFQTAGLDADAPRPLADLLRPRSIGDVVGQDHLLADEEPIGRMLASGRIASMILWGPPGVGKTTIARLIANHADMEFVQLSAVFSGVKDLREIFAAAEARRSTGRGTLLFVDEIHRFNKAQQDGFLPYVEAGIVTLIGATTENPSFELNGALLSRAQVFVLKRLSEKALDELLVRAEKTTEQDLPLTRDGRDALIAFADGDGRYLLNLAEEIFALTTKKKLDAKGVARHLQKRAPAYDKNREEHYNLISALHKSIRGSDPDAALYWLARMLTGGEDPLYIARRIVRMASEDIGLADPLALMLANEAMNTYRFLGSPEGELAIAHAVVHMATAPKSNAVYTAFKAAMRAAKKTGSLMPPAHILNAPTKMMKDLGYGKGYAYDHDTEEGFSGQNYFPDGMKRENFYAPKGEGREREIKARLERWAALRHDNRSD
ncbi:MAG: replication-associated recombination protein A [Robiginitomaculum sp.]|nr:replication-associated recombination protein A [Robiginitomaculum sp.]